MSEITWANGQRNLSTAYDHNATTERRPKTTTECLELSISIRPQITHGFSAEP